MPQRRKQQTARKVEVDLSWAVQQSATLGRSLEHALRIAMCSRARRELASFTRIDPATEEKDIGLVSQHAELLFGGRVADR